MERPTTAAVPAGFLHREQYKIHSRSRPWTKLKIFLHERIFTLFQRKAGQQLEIIITRMGLSFKYCMLYSFVSAITLTITRALSFAAAERVLFGRWVWRYRSLEAQNRGTSTNSNKDTNKKNGSSDPKTANSDSASTCHDCSSTIDTICRPWILSGPALSWFLLVHSSTEMLVESFLYGKPSKDAEKDRRMTQAAMNSILLSLAIDVLVVCTCAAAWVKGHMDRIVRQSTDGKVEVVEAKSLVEEK